MKRLGFKDQWALGFMTFALFLGAGNIIFPPSAGLAAGAGVWWAALGFLVTAVGLPILTLVVVAQAGGGMSHLTQPLGKSLGLGMAIVVYLAIGPLFATPRTAVVSFELAIVPLVGSSALALFSYALVYFALVLYLALGRGRLMERVGALITPVLLLGLCILGLSAVLQPAGNIPISPPDSAPSSPFLKGVLDGYLTMDTLGGLVFGVVITGALRDHGITDAAATVRYTLGAGLIAAGCLVGVYLAFFYLGATSGSLVTEPENGAQILLAYVHHTFGASGYLLLGVIISLACLTTAVGLVVACAEFFSQVFPIRYSILVVLLTLFSFAVANRGLTELIRVSLPVLIGLYPLAIMLVLLNLLGHLWRRPHIVFRPVLAVTFLCGLVDGLVAAQLNDWVPSFFRQLPLSEHNLAWFWPSLGMLLIAALVDRWWAARSKG